MKPVILAILQNQWFHEPDRVREMLARHDNNPDVKLRVRRRLICTALFAGCRTGRVLEKIFGPDCPNDFYWDEASPEIGGKASSCFPADIPHLKATIERVKPDIVIGFGKIACEALMHLVPPAKLVLAPHPTARGIYVPTRLVEAKIELDRLCQRNTTTESTALL